MSHMNKRIILQEGAYSIWRYDGIPAEAFTFLERIAWGNDGAVYENKKTKEHIQLVHKPTVMAIHESDKIQGTAVFCNVTVSIGNAAFNCFYVRYFASSKEIRGSGVMKKYGIKVMESVRNQEKDKTIFFACVEKGNKASFKAVKSAGYENLALIKTNGFSRFFPKIKKGIERVATDSDRKEVLALLKKQYSEYALVQFDSIFFKDNYFVIRENGEILAGCQYHKAHWVINRMPGWMGKVIMKIVPLVPVMNKIFNPKKFEFLAFEGIYVKKGFENKLADLFEGLLAKENLKSAIYWMGENCPIRQRILSKIKTGLIHSFIKDSDVFMMVAFHDFSEAEITDFKSRPIFVSGFDYI